MLCNNHVPSQQVQQPNANPAVLDLPSGAILNGKPLKNLVGYSLFSAAELRRRGLPANIIQIVEANRAELWEMLESRCRSFRDGVELLRNDQNQVLGMGANPDQSVVRSVRPSPAQAQAALDMITRVKKDCKACANAFKASRRTFMIPDAQRLEYNSTFEELWRLTTELDRRLPHYACVMKEDAAKKLVLMVFMVQQQREMLSGNMPRYFLSLEMIKVAIKWVQSASDAFKNCITSMTPGAHSNVAPAPAKPGQSLPDPALDERKVSPQIPHPPAFVHPDPPATVHRMPIAVSHTSHLCSKDSEDSYDETSAPAAAVTETHLERDA